VAAMLHLSDRQEVPAPARRWFQSLGS
jgi:hypothetical protein